MEQRYSWIGRVIAVRGMGSDWRIVLRYLSLFSGIEAATVAWETLGWEAVGFAEFEEFPKAVLAHHYPNVPDLGDVTKITNEQIKALGHIDIVVGGSPCQDLSIEIGQQSLF